MADTVEDFTVVPDLTVGGTVSSGTFTWVCDAVNINYVALHFSGLANIEIDSTDVNPSWYTQYPNFFDGATYPTLADLRAASPFSGTPIAPFWQQGVNATDWQTGALGHRDFQVPGAGWLVLAFNGSNGYGGQSGSMTWDVTYDPYDYPLETAGGSAVSQSLTLADLTGTYRIHHGYGTTQDIHPVTDTQVGQTVPALMVGVSGDTDFALDPFSYPPNTEPFRDQQRWWAFSIAKVRPTGPMTLTLSGELPVNPSAAVDSHSEVLMRTGIAFDDEYYEVKPASGVKIVSRTRVVGDWGGGSDKIIIPGDFLMVPEDTDDSRTVVVGPLALAGVAPTTALDPLGPIQSKTELDITHVDVDYHVIELPPLLFAPITKFQAGVAMQLPADATTANQPIMISMHFDATIELQPPSLVITDREANTRRVVGNTYVEMETPVIILGKPASPAIQARYPSTFHAVEGPTHIHTIANPDPIWDPATDGWYVGHEAPAISGVGDARWTVQTLPDPAGYAGQFYWLGKPDPRDYTVGIDPKAQLWAPDASTPYAPAWQSFFPYKPSVREHVYFGAGGNIVTQTKGVRLNLQFIEHMWLDWGADKPQPFTWVIVGAVMDWPNTDYVHYLLDAGKAPNQIGFPDKQANQVQQDYQVNDGLNYRNLMAVNRNSMMMGTVPNPVGGSRLSIPFPATPKPRMFFGIFNGAHSYAGNYSTDAKHIQQGTLANVAGVQKHRYYTLGRQQNWIGINHATHLVVFEIRFWNSALTKADLDEQYGQLSSTWQFNQYR